MQSNRTLPIKRKRPLQKNPNKAQKTMDCFFSKMPQRHVNHHLNTNSYNTHTVHNSSNHKLSTNLANILRKGLSFTPHHSFTSNDHLKVITQFDSFSDSLRNIIILQFNNSSRSTMQISSELDTEASFLYTQMKFIKGQTKKSHYPITISNIPELENFIESTKIQLDHHLSSCPSKPKRPNISKNELSAIKQILTNANIIIKPADKPLDSGT